MAVFIDIDKFELTIKFTTSSFSEVTELFDYNERVAALSSHKGETSIQFSIPMFMVNKFSQHREIVKSEIDKGF